MTNGFAIKDKEGIYRSIGTTESLAWSSLSAGQQWLIPYFKDKGYTCVPVEVREVSPFEEWLSENETKRWKADSGKVYYTTTKNQIGRTKDELEELYKKQFLTTKP